MKRGYTTGTCAAAAALAAAIMIKEDKAPAQVELTLPGGEEKIIPVVSCVKKSAGAAAEVIKDAGDDPDITNGIRISAAVKITANNCIIFKAGNGVGTVTKPGLQIAAGEPAINPVPRQMIKDALAIKDIYSAEVTVAAENGESLAKKTFNPKLGIKGGISIIGTTGIVRPYDRDSVKKTIEIMLNVAEKSGVKEIVLVAGNIGEKAALSSSEFNEEQIVSVGNEWETALNYIIESSFEKIKIVGHPGKLVKFLKDSFYTHSSEGINGVEVIKELCGADFNITQGEINTVEEILNHENKEEVKALIIFISEKIKDKTKVKIQGKMTVAIELINMKGDVLAKM